MQIKTALLSITCLCTLSIGCDAPEPQPEVPRNETEAPYLLDFTEDELVSVWEASEVEGSVDEWLDHHRRDFDCAEFGDLCDVVGEASAEEILRESYQRLIDGETVEDVQGWLEAEIEAVSEQAPQLDVGESFRAYQQSFNTQGNRRTRVRGYNIRPLQPFQGYAYAQCRHQVRANGSAPWLSNSANHRASIRSRRSTIIGGNVFNGAAIPSETGYRQRTATGTTVTSGNNLHGTGPWSLPLGGESVIRTRACCQTFGEPGFDSNVWCVGSTTPL
ncbi:MAG: hypothetical protein AAF799_08390 [Myxococcota bacterium]